MWSARAGGKSARRNASITAVPDSSVKVSGKTFMLRSSVHLLSNNDPGVSYIGIVQSGKKWVYCDNQKLSVGGWPKGAKGLYIVFYEHMSTHGTKSSSKVPHEVKTSGNKVSVKRKIAQLDVHDAACSKKTCVRVTKRTSTTTVSLDPGASENWGGITGFEPPVTRTVWPEYRYYPVDEEWQRQECARMNVRFVCSFQRIWWS